MRGFLMAVVMVTICPPSSAFAQRGVRSADATPAKSAVPRTPDGKPDLTGVWQGGSTQRGTWEEANAGLGVGGTGRDPSAPANPSSSERPAGAEMAPYQPWAAKKVVEAFNRRGIDDPTTLCLPPGLPRANNVSLFPIQIVQTPQQIVMLYEYMTIFRVIPLNAKHPDDLIPSYMGNSVGHWEGDTLVVDVTGFNDKTWLAGTGTFHSDALHITRAIYPCGQGSNQLRRGHAGSQCAHEALGDAFDPHASGRHPPSGICLRREQSGPGPS